MTSPGAGAAGRGSCGEEERMLERLAVNELRCVLMCYRPILAEGRFSHPQVNFRYRYQLLHDVTYRYATYGTFSDINFASHLMCQN